MIEIGVECLFFVIAVLQCFHDIDIGQCLCVLELLEDRLRLMQYQVSSCGSFSPLDLVSYIEIHQCEIYNRVVRSVVWYLVICDIYIFLTGPESQPGKCIYWQSIDETYEDKTVFDHMHPQERRTIEVRD